MPWTRVTRPYGRYLWAIRPEGPSGAMLAAAAMLGRMKHDTSLRDRVTSRRTLLEGGAYDLEALTLAGPGGERVKGMVRHHRGAVVILPLLEQPGRSPKIVFVRNDRHTINARLLELPAGGIDGGESPADAAARELVEETGYRAATIEPLLSFYTTPGLTDEVMHAFVATGLIYSGQRLEADESLTVEVLTVGEAASLLRPGGPSGGPGGGAGAGVGGGGVIDGKSALTLLAAQRAKWLDV